MFSGTGGGQTGLWAMSIKNGVADGAPAFVRSSEAFRGGNSVSRAGSILGYRSSVGTQAFLVTKRPDQASWGAPETLGIPNDFRMSASSWSPDGAYLSWHWVTSGLASVYVWSAESKSLRVIPTTLSGFFTLVDPIWKDNAREFLVAGRTSNEQAFYRINVESGSVTRVTTPVPFDQTANDGVSLAAMTPDERFYLKWVVHSGDPGNTRSLIRVDARTSAETLLVRAAGSIGSVSPDGQWWAVTGFMGSPKEETAAQTVGATALPMRVVPIAGGAPRDLCTFTMPEGARRGSVGGLAKWSADSKVAYFSVVTGNEPEARAEILGMPDSTAALRGARALLCANSGASRRIPMAVEWPTPCGRQTTTRSGCTRAS